MWVEMLVYCLVFRYELMSRVKCICVMNGKNVYSLDPQIINHDLLLRKT